MSNNAPFGMPPPKSHAPERIYGWMNSQMSVARFSGGMTYQGHSYVIAYHEDGQPLVRWDVVQREAKALPDERKAAKAANAAQQGALL